MDTSQFSLFSGQPDAASVQLQEPKGPNYRLTSDRLLAKSWRGRTVDNIAAIELSQTLEREARLPTKSECDRLIKWTGFGASAVVNALFPTNGVHPDGWKELGEQLHKVVAPADLPDMQSATQYAHYTPEYVVKAIWDGALRLGFRGGPALEPGCGSGLFIALTPARVAALTRFTAIEQDPTTFRIARALYAGATVVRGDFTDYALPMPGNPYTLAIGNPPFSDARVKDVSGGKLAMHEFFINRSMRALQPGGIGAFVCSRYLMDGGSADARMRIAEIADLLGAVRLPAGSMRAEAGTDVVVDVLFLRRRADKPCREAQDWMSTTGVTATFGGSSVAVNEYYAAHPEMVLGNHGIAINQFGQPAYTCKATGADLPTALLGAVERLPLLPPIRIPVETKRLDIDMTGIYAREGSYFVIPGSGAIGQIQRGVPVQVPMRGAGVSGLSKPDALLIRDIIPIRDYARQIINAQAADRPWQDLQRNLRIAYRRFTDVHGPVNKTILQNRNVKRWVEDEDEETGEVTNRRQVTTEYVHFSRPNLAPFADDPDSALVASVEHYDPDTGIAVPGQIFTKRVVGAAKQRSIESVADAMAVVLDVHGKIDIDRIADMRGIDRDTAISQLGDLVYQDPVSGEWQTSDEYLSGPVRTKLAVAEAQAAIVPAYQRNVDALRIVQPVELQPSDVDVRLGMPLVPSSMVVEFCHQVLGVPGAQITHVPQAVMWSVEGWAFRNTSRGNEYGTHRRDAGKILEDALNMRIPRIFDTAWVDGKKVQVFNPEETEAAKDKLEKLQVAFGAWIWKDPGRAVQLIRVYNNTFNNLVSRSFDGSHLTLPGLSWACRPYQHQLRVIWRIVSRGNCYIAHDVGAGKTLCMIAAIMEQRRLGLIQKAMVVVPGHTLAQWEREFVQNYPDCRILVADEDNFEKADRLRFMARAASNDWDAIIITHSAFGHLSAPNSFERDMIQQEIENYSVMLSMMSATKDRAAENHLARKRLENAKEKLKLRLKALATKKDDFLSIDQIGVNQLVIDEGQAFRKLPIATNMSTLKGIDPKGSGRAWDLYVKSRYTDSINPGRGLIMASGTPIVNTMGEMHTLLRFMNPESLTSRRVFGFDAWAATFGQTVTTLELGPSGMYKPVTRFAKFVNVPELSAMFREVADVLTGTALAEFVKLPAIVDGQRAVLSSPPSDVFKRGQKWLGKRIRAIENRRGRPRKGQDIILSVINDGRHLAIDTRLVRPDSPIEPDNKLNRLIANVFKIWQETSDYRYDHPVTHQPYLLPGAAQLVFSDIGTLAIEEVRGFSAYRWIKQSLIALGVPERQIAFMQDYKRTSEKLRLFSEVNSGRVRVLIGSSETMGTGVNVQTRLIALHHLDVPWLPAWIAQREGRMVRQGNQNSKVYLFAYATLTSLDAQMWQTNERKARFIMAALDGDKSVRRMDDCSDPADQFALAKAIASGDARLMQLAGLTSDVARMERLRAAHFNEQYSVRSEVQFLERHIAAQQAVLPLLESDVAKREDTKAEAFKLVFGENTVSERVNAGQLILSRIAAARASETVGRMEIGTIGGFMVVLNGKIDHSSDLIVGKTVPKSFYTVPLSLELTGRNCGLPYGDGNPLAIVRHIETTIQGLDRDLEDCRSRIKSASEKLERVSGANGAVWPYEEELAEKTRLLSELEKELASNKPLEDDDIDSDGFAAD